MLQSVRTRIAKFIRLNQGRRRALLLAGLLLPLAWVAVHALGFERVRRLVFAGKPGPGPERKDESTIGDCVAGVAIAAHHLPLPSTCLTRSLVLAWLLRRLGLSPALRIGVRREASRLHAHAWLQLDRLPVSDMPEQLAGFTPLPPFLSEIPSER